MKKSLRNIALILLAKPLLSVIDAVLNIVYALKVTVKKSIKQFFILFTLGIFTTIFLLTTIISFSAFIFFYLITQGISTIAASGFICVGHCSMLLIIFYLLHLNMNSLKKKYNAV